MKRATAVLALLILASCASSANRSALENAKLAYADLSLAYEVAIQTVSDVRAQHQVTDAQWAQVDKAQKIVQQATPQLRAALDLWASSGTQPASYAAIEKEIADAIATVTKISAEVKP